MNSLLSDNNPSFIQLELYIEHQRVLPSSALFSGTPAAIHEQGSTCDVHNEYDMVPSAGRPWSRDNSPPSHAKTRYVIVDLA
jgi:hypothetical protein